MALRLHSVRLVVVFIWHMISHVFRSCSRHPPITNSTDATKIMAKVYSNQNLIVVYFVPLLLNRFLVIVFDFRISPMKQSRYYVLFDIRLNLDLLTDHLKLLNGGDDRFWMYREQQNRKIIQILMFQSRCYRLFTLTLFHFMKYVMIFRVACVLITIYWK